MRLVPRNSYLYQQADGSEAPRAGVVKEKFPKEKERSQSRSLGGCAGTELGVETQPLTRQLRVKVLASRRPSANFIEARAKGKVAMPKPAGAPQAALM